MAVQFAYGTQKEFRELKLQNKIDSECIYFIPDTQRIYRGDELISKSDVMFPSALPVGEDVLDNMIYVVKETNSDEKEVVNVYTTNGSDTALVASTGWNISVDDFYTKIHKFTSNSVKQNAWNYANDKQLVTAGALKESLSWKILSN